MKHFVLVFFLSLFATSVTFASFPVKKSSNKKETITAVTSESTANASKKETKANKKIEKRLAKAQKKAAKKAAKNAGDDNTVAIILAVLSVVFLPVSFHNWYLGNKNKALWQTLLFFPGFILIIPAIVSWVWQVIDLFQLIANS